MFDFVIHLILIAASVVVCFCIAVELVKVRVRRESAISDAGGIDEMVSLRVNSCELWLHIRGHDRKKWGLGRGALATALSSLLLPGITQS